MSLSNKLKELKADLEQGRITQVEYEVTRKLLLSSLSSKTTEVANAAPNLDMGTVVVDGNSVEPTKIPNQRVLKAGDRFEDYIIIKTMGKGGMGAVYKAKHNLPQIASVDGYVAIKVMHPHLSADKTFRDRFIQESSLGKSLSHPNVVKVHHIYTKTLALVLSFVDGKELSSYIGSGLPIEHVVNIIRPIASALDYLHSQEIVHRDVKPANIMLTSSGVPMLLDLGIAKSTRTISKMTEANTAIGTEIFMPPEQLLGNDVGFSADQYALAMSVFITLTGNVPWEQTTSPMKIGLMKMENNFESFNARLSQQDESVQNSLKRALQSDPTKRFTSCTEFIETLAGQIEVPKVVETTVSLHEDSSISLTTEHTIVDETQSQLANHPDLIWWGSALPFLLHFFKLIGISEHRTLLYLDKKTIMFVGGTLLSVFILFYVYPLVGVGVGLSAYAYGMRRTIKYADKEREKAEKKSIFFRGVSSIVTFFIGAIVMFVLLGGLMYFLSQEILDFSSNIGQNSSSVEDTKELVTQIENQSSEIVKTKDPSPQNEELQEVTGDSEEEFVGTIDIDEEDYRPFKDWANSTGGIIMDVPIGDEPQEKQKLPVEAKAFTLTNESSIDFENLSPVLEVPENSHYVTFFSWVQLSDTAVSRVRLSKSFYVIEYGSGVIDIFDRESKEKVNTINHKAKRTQTDMIVVEDMLVFRLVSLENQVQDIDDEEYVIFDMGTGEQIPLPKLDYSLSYSIPKVSVSMASNKEMFFQTRFTLPADEDSYGLMLWGTKSNSQTLFPSVRVQKNTSPNSYTQFSASVSNGRLYQSRSFPTGVFCSGLDELFIVKYSAGKWEPLEIPKGRHCKNYTDLESVSYTAYIEYPLGMYVDNGFMNFTSFDLKTGSEKFVFQHPISSEAQVVYANSDEVVVFDNNDLYRYNVQDFTQKVIHFSKEYRISSYSYRSNEFLVKTVLGDQTSIYKIDLQDESLRGNNE